MIPFISLSICYYPVYLDFQLIIFLYSQLSRLLLLSPLQKCSIPLCGFSDVTFLESICRLAMWTFKTLFYWMCKHISIPLTDELRGTPQLRHSSSPWRSTIRQRKFLTMSPISSSLISLCSPTWSSGFISFQFCAQGCLSILVIHMIIVCPPNACIIERSWLMLLLTENKSPLVFLPKYCLRLTG